MDTQTTYHHHGGYNQEHENIVGHNHEGEEENHHEKKSVLKKVKQKAKKIKDTITKHGHGHNHNHDHDRGHQYHEGGIPDDHDLDEEDDYDDEEDIVDPEVHGAPMYESVGARSVVSQQPEELSRPGISYERSNAIHPDSSLAPTDNSTTFNSGSEKTKFNNDSSKTSVTGLEALATGEPKVNYGKQTAIFDEPLAPQNTPVPISRQSRDVDPTYTFVHGKEEYAGQPKVNLQRPKGLEDDPAAPKDTLDACTPTNYQTKVTDPSGKGGEVTGITPILHSFDKMNFDDKQDTRKKQNFPPAGGHHRPSDLPFPTGSHDQFSPEPAAPSLTKTPEKSPSVSETMDTLKPQEHLHNMESDKPSNQSSYTEKISSATSAIADKAVSAKNIVASKLRYGEKDATAVNNKSHEGQDNATKQSSAVDYGKKLAVTVTEKLTPVYEKVAEVGSTVMSKLHGPGTGTTVEVGTEVQEQDKGVSITSYLSEKLRPSEEDRALSGLITDALNTQKDKAEKETRARGKVTESEEVARRLGSGSENSPTSSEVYKLKGTVG